MTHRKWSSRGRFWAPVVLCTSISILSLRADAQVNGSSAAASNLSQLLSDEEVSGIGGLIEYILVKNLPKEYEDTSKWGGTKEVWAGINVSRDGWQIKTSQRKRTVNHGTWERYRIQPIDAHDTLQVRIENSQTVPGKGIGFDLVVVSRFAISGRRSEWQRGIQLYSLSAEAEAQVRLRMRCVVGMSLDLKSFPIALSLDPVVDEAQLDLTEFRLNRISRLDGPVVHELGHALHDILQREVDRHSGKLVARINDQIDKHRDVLRISLDGILPGVDKAWSHLGNSEES